MATAVVLLAGALFFVFRDGNTRKVKELCIEFGNAVKADDRAKMTQLYPALTDSDKLYVSINEDSISVNKDSLGYIATIGKDRELIVKALEDDKFVIEDSRGVYDFSDRDLDLASKTGQYKPSLTDRQNKARLDEKGFEAWLVENLKKKLYGIITMTTFTKDTEPGFPPDMYARITNNSDVDLEADDYRLKITFRHGAFHYEESSYSKYSRVPANSNKSILIGNANEGNLYIYDVELKLTMPTEKLIKAVKPTGNEYDEYLKLKVDFPDGHYCYEGNWTSKKYPTPYPIRVEFDKNGNELSNGMYTNIKFNIKMALKGTFDGTALKLTGKNVIFELSADGDVSHLSGLGMDIKRQGEADIDMELLK